MRAKPAFEAISGLQNNGLRSYMNWQPASEYNVTFISLTHNNYYQPSNLLNVCLNPTNFFLFQLRLHKGTFIVIEINKD